MIETKQTIGSDDFWEILIESPNFNELTLMTTVIDVGKGTIRYEIWNTTSGK